MRRLGAYAAVHLLGGAGRFQDARGTDRAVSAGDVLLIFPDVPHAYGPGPGQTWDEIYFVFDGPVFDAWRRSRTIDPARPVVRAEAIEYWFDRWNQVAQKTDALQTVCALQQTLADLLTLPSALPSLAGEQAWLGRARRRLDALSPDDRPDWETLSASLGLSYAGFRKRFTRLAGRTPGAYVESRRLDLATRLLGRPGMVMKQIARESGFCDEFHFSRRFKRYTGLTPRDYRRRVGV